MIAFWLTLGLPSISLLIVMAAPTLLGCEIGYGYTDCPRVVMVLLRPAAFGGITIVPFFAIGTIWLIFATIIIIAQRRES